MLLETLRTAKIANAARSERQPMCKAKRRSVPRITSARLLKSQNFSGHAAFGHVSMHSQVAFRPVTKMNQKVIGFAGAMDPPPSEKAEQRNSTKTPCSNRIGRWITMKTGAMRCPGRSERTHARLIFPVDQKNRTARSKIPRNNAVLRATYSIS